MRPLVLTTLLGASLLLPFGARAGSPGEVDQRRPAAVDGVVEITNRAGSTLVVGWERAEVAVSGRLGHDAKGVEITSAPGETHIKVGAHGNPLEVASALEVRVPRRSRVQVKGFSASVTADNLGGSLTVQVFDGSITVRRGPAQVTAKTVSGSIDVEGGASRLEARSVNGSITLRGASGDLKAKSVNGSVTVAGGRFDRVSISTVAGAARFSGSLSPKGELDARSVNGTVEISLAPDTGAQFSLSSVNGGLESDFAHAGASGTGSDRKLVFSTGAGQARVNATSVNGSVRVKKR